MPGGPKLTRKQEPALAALLAEPTQEKAAEAAQVSLATLKRWLNDPDFAAAYRVARGRVLEAGILAMQRAAGQAVEALVGQLASEDGRIRVSAARSVLEFAFRGAELLDLFARLEALEQQQAEQPPPLFPDPEASGDSPNGHPPAAPVADGDATLALDLPPLDLPPLFPDRG